MAMIVSGKGSDPKQTRIPRGTGFKGIEVRGRFLPNNKRNKMLKCTMTVRNLMKSGMLKVQITLKINVSVKRKLNTVSSTTDTRNLIMMGKRK